MTIFGLLGLADTDSSFVNSIGQRLVFEAAQEYIRAHNADLQQAASVFVEATTEEIKERYKLPGGGRLQRRGGQAQSAAVKPYGGWDVAYPLEDFGVQLASDMIETAYMTVGHLQNHLDTIRIQDMSTLRFEMLKALFNNTQRAFEDDHRGNLLIEPLANGDAVTYPPVIGSETQASEDHYLVSGYVAADISDANNPYETLLNEFEEHFGTPSGFGNTAVFINTAQKAKTEALVDYDPVNDRYVTPGDDTATVIGLPRVPGRVMGRVSGVWVIEWRWVPANYMLAIDLDRPAPLKMRVDPASTGLPRGLTLISQSDENPFERSHWMHRFGIGVGNRLNGAVMQLKASGSYDIPAAYA